MADIESDLSAFHRIDDPMQLDGPRFFRLAVRLSAYSGVLAARAYEEQKRREGDAPAPSRHSPQGEAPRQVSAEVARSMLD